MSSATPASSRQDSSQQQQQQPRRGGPAFPSSSDDSGVPEDISRDENWASPAEVLQFRALWETTQGKHRAEVQQLRKQLEVMERERDHLIAEVHETERLREQYRLSRTAFETVRHEKNQWQEEREMLMLRLQRMANEIDRLRAHVGSSVGSSGGASSDQLSGASSLASQHTLIGLTTPEETISLLEQLHRYSVEAAAMEQRYELRSIVAHFDLEKLRRQYFVVVGENEMLKNKIRVIADGEENTRRSLRFAQQECNSLKDNIESAEQRLKTQDAKHKQEVMDSERQWEAAWKEDVSFKEHQWKLNETNFHEQIAALYLERDAAISKADELVRKKERMLEEHAEETTQLVNENSELRKQLLDARSFIQEHQRHHNVDVAVLREENRGLQLSREQTLHANDLLNVEIESIRKELHELRAHFEHQGVELTRHRKQCESLAVQADGAKNLEGERDAYRVRATKLEEEISVQREFYEKQMRVLHQAFLTLQNQKRLESDTLLREIVNTRNIASQRNPKKADKKQSNEVPKEGNANTGNNGHTVNPLSAALSASGPLIDPLQLLRNTNALADKLQSEVQS